MSCTPMVVLRADGDDIPSAKRGGGPFIANTVDPPAGILGIPGPYDRYTWRG
ncbi:MAG: hypothetical protein IT432_09105 [Phycisphaerales bacterium]|nr:hypothetical protein [Phycisphaerales bacterium]